MAARGAIFGTSGPALTPKEKGFYREVDPWGFILFARNVESPDQVRRLVGDLREAVGRDAPVLIDQEGGRVDRLTSIEHTKWPNAFDFVASIGPEHRVEAMRLRYAAIGAELAALGVDVNCAPMCDVARPDMHPRLRERCYGEAASDVAVLGQAVADGLADAGILPVLKHMPGHGRATLDSHEQLPMVDAPRETLAKTDFAPFRALNHLPLGMTAHIVFRDIDPDRPATQSPDTIRVIRDEIGFQGALMTDDLNMKALSGTMTDKVTAALGAGCDLMLHCNGNLAEMEEVAAATPMLAGRSLARCDAALASRSTARVSVRDIPDLLTRIAQFTLEVSHA